MTDSVEMPNPSQVLVGIFVGGASSRMGQAKGLLPSPQSKYTQRADATLVEELWAMSANKLGCVTVLVGERSEYEFLKRPTVRDVVMGAGPLSGLVALFDQATSLGKKFVVAIACDLPYLSAELLERLLRFEAGPAAVCPMIDGKYQPLFARYDASHASVFRAALNSGRYALQPLFKQLDAAILPLHAREEIQLVDWDSPADIQRER